MARTGKPRLDLNEISPDKRAVLERMKRDILVILLKRLGGRVEVSDHDFDAVDGLTILFEAEGNTLILSVGKAGGAEGANG